MAQWVAEKNRSWLPIPRLKNNRPRPWRDGEVKDMAADAGQDCLVRPARNAKPDCGHLELVHARKERNAGPIGPAIEVDFTPRWRQSLDVVDCRDLGIKQRLRP